MSARGFSVYATTPETLAPQHIAAHAQRAEAMGYDGLLVPDAAHDGFLLAALALNATRRLRVCIGVLVVFPRSPMNVALAAWDLQSMSQGRFELGLGSQVQANIEQRYSVSWTKPVQRMRDYIGALRAIFAAFQESSPLHFLSENYRFTRLQPFFNPGPITHPQIPLLLGAVGPRMTELAGEIADGLITHPTASAPRYLREIVWPRLETGAARAGRSAAAFRVHVGALVATGADRDEVARQREKWRGMLAFLFSTPAYWPSLEFFGWKEKGEQLRLLVRENRWGEMDSVVDDALLDSLVPAANYADIARRLSDWYGGLGGCVNMPLPDSIRDDALAARAVADLRQPLAAASADEG